MVRGRLTYDASTSDWGFPEWAHEAGILRQTQDAIMARKEQERRDQLARLATGLAQLTVKKAEQVDQGEDT